MPDRPSVTLEDLRRQLHEANERYHALRQQWEKWLDASEYRHGERVNHAREELEAAERDVEAIEARITKALEVSASPTKFST
jgi:chromosome segregation ATPase